MRSQFANLRTLVIPTGAVNSIRIVFDGVNGVISLYDENNDLVGQITPDGWIAGKVDSARVSIDPFGGIRITDENGTLVAVLDPTQGLQIRDPITGIVQVQIQHDGFFYTDDTATQTIVMGTTPGLPIPRYAATPTPSGGAGIVTTPAVEQFGTDDLEIRHAALFHASDDLTGESFNALAGYTRILNDTHFLSVGGSSLAALVATRQPAVSDAIRLWTYSDLSVGRGLGTTVVIEAESGVAPSVRSIASDFFTYSSPIVDVNLIGGTTAADDLHLAFVTFANDNPEISLPTSWTTPKGWVFLGGTFASDTSPLAVGVWAHLSSSATPPDEVVRITKLGGSSPTQIHWAVLSIQNAKLLPRYTDIRINGQSIPRGRVVGYTPSTTDSVALDIVGRIRTLPGTPVTVTNNTGGTRRYSATIFARFRMDAGTDGLYRPLVTNGLDGGSAVALSTSPAQCFTTITGAAGEVGNMAQYEFTLAPGASQLLGAGGLRVAGGSATDDIRMGYIYVDDIGE